MATTCKSIGEIKMMTTIQKALFFFFVIALAFVPGGIFISVFLLSLYYLCPLFLENNSNEEEKRTFEENVEALKFTIPFKVVDITVTDAEKTDMKSYSDDTLEEMK